MEDRDMRNCSRWNGELLALCGDKRYHWEVLEEAAYDAVRWLRFIIAFPYTTGTALAAKDDDIGDRFAALASYARITGQCSATTCGGRAYRRVESF
jgi:hypothetical protein